MSTDTVATTNAATHSPANPAWFRQVLGQYPTGVCMITGRDEEGEPVGMVVGSFSSVSLNPPLVAFLPDRNSSTWARLRNAQHFCVNILGAEQEGVCRRFAGKDSQRAKFQGLQMRSSPLGSPIVGDVVAWIDCRRHIVHEAGDHDIVIGEVQHLHIEAGGLPLLFFQGGYGRFMPLSLAAPDPLGTLTTQLRSVDVARPYMEALAESLSARCIATVRLEQEIVVAASAGQSLRGTVATLVGQRFPFMPPTSTVFGAWLDDKSRAAWLAATAPSARIAECEAAAVRVRERGYSIGLISAAQREFAQAVHRLAQQRSPESGESPENDMRGLIQGLSFDPPEFDDDVARAVRLVSAPVRTRDNNVVMALTLYDFPRARNLTHAQQLVQSVCQTAAVIAEKLMP